MQTVDVRMRWAMISVGLEPTTETAAREFKIPLTRAAKLLTLVTPPEDVADFASAARRCDVRMIWLSTGQSIPQISEHLTRDERKLLQLADGMDADTLRTFIAIGESLVTVK